MIIGALIRVFVVSGPRVFRPIVAAVLLPLGLWLCVRTLRPRRNPPRRSPSSRAITVLAVAVGIIGGIYGIGGGSLLGPVLVGHGLPVSTVAPAALTSTFLTSLAGALTYTLLALTTTGDIAPNWPPKPFADKAFGHRASTDATSPRGALALGTRRPTIKPAWLTNEVGKYKLTVSGNLPA